MAYDRADWSQHYLDERGFRPLRDSERDLITLRLVFPAGHILDKTSSRLVVRWPGPRRAQQTATETTALAETGGSR
ncbi:hypothetical protein [Streptomyces sp. NPDC101150]|uniref:hypothetical protein n=1 Tax=Streptomyces sp. NPDC101150 TaxID=3366114 RepID=UPI003806F108